MSLTEFITPDNTEFWLATYPAVGVWVGRIFARLHWKAQVAERNTNLEYNEEQDRLYDEERKREHAKYEKISADNPFGGYLPRSYRSYYSLSRYEHRKVRSLERIRKDAFYTFAWAGMLWPIPLLFTGSEKTWKATRSPRKSFRSIAGKTATRVAIGKPAIQEFNREEFKALQKRNAELEKELDL